MPAHFLGIDAGGSRTRATLISDQGELVGLGYSGAANFRTYSFARSSLSIQEAVAQAIKHTSLTQVETVCIGSAGLEEPGTEEEGRKFLGNVICANQVLLDTDAYIAWAAALKAQPGVIIISGTGSIGLGVDLAQVRHRVGGWGPYFGDEGSAYWIANKAIREALKVLDGRSKNTAFLDALLEFAGLPRQLSQTNAHALTTWLYARESSTELANFAPWITRLAEHNPSAKLLLEDAGKSLAELVEAILQQGSFQHPVTVSIGGSVLKYSMPTKNAFLHHLPKTCTFSEPMLPPVLGATLLAWLSQNPWSTSIIDHLEKIATQHSELA